MIVFLKEKNKNRVLSRLRSLNYTRVFIHKNFKIHGAIIKKILSYQKNMIFYKI